MTTTTAQPHSVSTAAAIITQLRAAGVTDVVLCPGSRNAPLALAAATTPGLTLHTRIDERAASFTALGLARAQRRHTVVITTSGTAVANCLPAMIEAHYSNTPLIVLSADRPAHLHGTGASQTIEQAHLFDTYATTHTIPATTTPHDAATITARLLNSPRVHINAEFDDPLVGTTPPHPTDNTTDAAALAVDSGADKESDAGAGVSAGAGVAASAGVSAAAGVHTGGGEAAHPDVDQVTIDLSKNTLIIAGDGAWDVPGLEDVPTIAEPTAPTPFHPVHPLAAHFFSKDSISHNDYTLHTKPEQIIIVGRPTLHRPVLALTTDPSIDITILSRDAEPYRPTGRTSVHARTITTTGQPTGHWLKICDAASNLAADTVRTTLDNPEHGFTGLHAAAAVADTLAVGDTLIIGSSNPIRDMSLVGLPFDGVATHTPRGAAGIDGTVSQAMGIALATQQQHPDTPRPPRTVAFIGDITFLHDVGGLLTPTNSPRPENLTIVIANDNGGSIFETLEVGAPGLRDTFETCFATPHDTHIKHLAEAYNTHYLHATTLRELLDALIDTTDTPHGVTIIEATVTRATRRTMHHQLTTT